MLQTETLYQSQMSIFMRERKVKRRVKVVSKLLGREKNEIWSSISCQLIRQIQTQEIKVDISDIQRVWKFI